MEMEESPEQGLGRVRRPCRQHAENDRVEQNAGSTETKKES